MKRALLAVLAVGVALVVSSSASAAKLVGYWPLLEGSGQTVHDLSGFRNDGTLGSTPGPDANDPTWIRTGLLRALHFGGKQWVAIPNSSVLQPANVTVGALVRASTSPGQFSYIFSKGGFSCTAASYGLYSGFGGGIGFYVSNGESFAVSPEASPSIWNGAWHFVAGTFDGSVVRLYVDGAEVGNGTPTSLTIGYNLDSQLPYIGAYRGSCAFTFQGDISQVNVWDSALPISTIWQKTLQVLSAAR